MYTAIKSVELIFIVIFLLSSNKYANIGSVQIGLYIEQKSHLAVAQDILFRNRLSYFLNWRSDCDYPLINRFIILYCTSVQLKQHKERTQKVLSSSNTGGRTDIR